MVDQLTKEQSAEIIALLESPLSAKLRRGFANVMNECLPDPFRDADEGLILIFSLMKIAGGFIGISSDHLPEAVQIESRNKLIAQASQLMLTCAEEASKFKGRVTQ